MFPTYIQASDSSASSTQFPQMELVRVDIYLSWWVVVIHDTCSYWTIEMFSQFVFAPSLIQFVELLDDSRRLKTRSFSHYVSSVSSLTIVGEPSFKPPNLRSDCWSCSMVTRWKFTHTHRHTYIYIYVYIHHMYIWHICIHAYARPYRYHIHALPETAVAPEHILKFNGWKINFTWEWHIFRCYVSFSQCIYMYIYSDIFRLFDGLYQSCGPTTTHLKYGMFLSQEASLRSTLLWTTSA